MHILSKIIIRSVQHYFMSRILLVAFVGSLTFVVSKKSDRKMLHTVPMNLSVDYCHLDTYSINNADTH
jgi:hypothetical protein